MVRDAVSAPALAALPAVRAAAFVAEEESAAPEASTFEATAVSSTGTARSRAGRGSLPLAALHLRERLASTLPALVLVWAAGVGLLSVRVLGGWWVAQRLKRSGHPVSLDSWHEAAGRLCRRMRIYHPAVWWVSYRMRVEREHCCDDVAVTVCGVPVGYARALAELEELRAIAPHLAVAASGGSLWLRVARLVGGPPPHLSRSSRWAAGLFALATPTALGLSAGASVEGGTPSRLAEPAAARLVLADYGVTNDYIRCLAELGYEDLSQGQLIALRSNGVSASYVDGLKELGYESLTPLSLVALRSQGVTPAYVEGLKDLGYEGLSLSLLIGLRSQGVDPSFIKGLQEEGYENLAPGELVLLRQSGVTPHYVSRLKASGYDDLTTDQLVALRQSGVDPKQEEEDEEKEDDPAEHKPCPEQKRHSGEEEK
jgi:hypothetical protein